MMEVHPHPCNELWPRNSEHQEWCHLASQVHTFERSPSTSWYACCASPSFRRPSLDSEIICTRTCLISRSFTSTRSSGVTPTFCTRSNLASSALCCCSVIETLIYKWFCLDCLSRKAHGHGE